MNDDVNAETEKAKAQLEHARQQGRAEIAAETSTAVLHWRRRGNIALVALFVVVIIATVMGTLWVSSIGNSADVANQNANAVRAAQIAACEDSLTVGGVRRVAAHITKILSGNIAQDAQQQRELPKDALANLAAAAGIPVATFEKLQKEQLKRADNKVRKLGRDRRTLLDVHCRAQYSRHGGQGG